MCIADVSPVDVDNALVVAVVIGGIGIGVVCAVDVASAAGAGAIGAIGAIGALVRVPVTLARNFELGANTPW